MRLRFSGADRRRASVYPRSGDAHVTMMRPIRMTARPPTSELLAGLLGHETPARVTLGCLLDGLGDRSFGVVLLVLALLALLPGVSAVAGMVLMVPAFQMVLGRRGAVFPRRVAARRFEAERLARVVRRVVPALRFLERFIRPRWATPVEATKRAVGGTVLLLAACLFAPVPLRNFPPALTIAPIAFACLEEDGVLLGAALAAALAMLAVAALAVWEALSATGWVPGIL